MGLISFLDTYGKIASVCLSLYMIWCLLGKIVPLMYGGCQFYKGWRDAALKMLWSFCPTMFLLRDRRRQEQRRQEEEDPKLSRGGRIRRSFTNFFSRRGSVASGSSNPDPRSPSSLRSPIIRHSRTDSPTIQLRNLLDRETPDPEIEATARSKSLADLAPRSFRLKSAMRRPTESPPTRISYKPLSEPPCPPERLSYANLLHGNVLQDPALQARLRAVALEESERQQHQPQGATASAPPIEPLQQKGFSERGPI